MDFNILREWEAGSTGFQALVCLGYTYGVDISNEEDPVFMLALVIVLDQVLHDNNHNNG